MAERESQQRDRDGSGTGADTMPEGLMPGVPAAAGWLGLAGLIPFVVLALALVSGLGGAVLPAGMTAGLLAGYGAVILAFMGGCRWGFAAAGLGAGAGTRRAAWRYALSVVPALWAWPMLALPDPWRLGLLGAGFVGLLAADLALARDGGAPGWWPALRWPLSLGAAGSLLLGALLG